MPLFLLKAACELGCWSTLRRFPPPSPELCTALLRIASNPLPWTPAGVVGLHPSTPELDSPLLAAARALYGAAVLVREARKATGGGGRLCLSSMDGVVKHAGAVAAGDQDVEMGSSSSSSSSSSSLSTSSRGSRVDAFSSVLCKAARFALSLAESQSLRVDSGVSEAEERWKREEEERREEEREAEEAKLREEEEAREAEAKAKAKAKEESEAGKDKGTDKGTDKDKPPLELSPAAAQLAEMGFDAYACEAVSSMFGGDINSALMYMLDPSNADELEMFSAQERARLERQSRAPSASSGGGAASSATGADSSSSRSSSSSSASPAKPFPEKVSLPASVQAAGLVAAPAAVRAERDVMRENAMMGEFLRLPCLSPTSASVLFSLE